LRKAEKWETIIIILSILFLFPVVYWYNSDRDTPFYYHVVLVVVLCVLGYITYRRAKRLRSAMRDLEEKRKRGPMPPFF
jgi:hypothetical protein